MKVLITAKCPILNVQSLACSGALPSQLNQANDLSRLVATGGEIALAIESADQLAVVLGVGGGLHGGNDLLDGLAVLDGGQGTVALARLPAVAVVLGPNARLELVFLDIQVELHRALAYWTLLPALIDGKSSLTFLKLPLSPRTQKRSCSSSGLTTVALAVTIVPLA